MPFLLNIKKDISDYAVFKSVLIVPCRFCPAASASVRNNKPYLKMLPNFLKTECYEQEIYALKAKLENKGIKTDIFRSKLIHQFVLCMWTVSRRKKLRKIAKRYDALIVLGCEAATQTVRDAVGPTSCKIFQGLETEGIMSIQPRFSLPLSISLELESVTPTICRNSQPDNTILV